MTQTVLILGASGRFGRNVSARFQAAGWAVRHFDRRRDNLTTAANGVDVIANAWNPPYPDWGRQVAALHGQVIDAAKEAGATVLVPGNVYVFGADAPVPWGADTPHLAQNPLGRVRVEMEQAYRRSGVRTIILRSGDFIDTRASGNWFDQVLTRSLAKGLFTYPGRPDAAHSWAYLPDVCQAAVELAEMRASLPVFSDIAFPGYTLSGNEMNAVLNRVARHPVRLKQMSWVPLFLARPFWTMAACLVEMRYLWDTPHRLDGEVFEKLLPEFRATQIESALASAIQTGSVQRQIDPDQAVATGG